MSDVYLPTLAGVYLDERIPFFETTVQSASSGPEARIKRRTVRYRYVMRVGLRPELSEHTTLSDFFIARGGRYDTFLYVDPFDGMTRRVRFDVDDLGLKKGRDPFWSGSFEMVSVI